MLPKTLLFLYNTHQFFSPKWLQSASALLVTWARLVIRALIEDLILPFKAPPENPSMQVLSSVRAALTHVSTLLMCHMNSFPRAWPMLFSSLIDLLRRSTLSLISSRQSLMAARSLGLSPWNLVSRTTNVWVDWARSRLTDKAVCTNWRGLRWMVGAYTDNDWTQTTGYVVALHEALMKFVAGLVAATVVDSILVGMKKTETKISDNVRAALAIFLSSRQHKNGRIRKMRSPTNIYIEAIEVFTSLLPLHCCGSQILA